MGLWVGRWFVRAVDGALKSRPSKDPAAPPEPPPKLLTSRYIKLYSLLGVLLSLVLIPWCAYLLHHIDDPPAHAATTAVSAELPASAPTKPPASKSSAANTLIPLLLFPLPMAAILNIGGEETTFCILAAFQFPIYGLFLGYGRGIDGLPSFSIALAVAHIASIVFSAMSFL